ncbi:SIS domain-containing protein [Pseudonocardia sp. CA-142604]|uniref:SIS domain-containing protein n=1 Tax=Pseudonocardia sp. CA-142604 TaxID=3240024 RepID=UPI003D922873
MASGIRSTAGVSALDDRQRAVLTRVADAERAAMPALPTDDPCDAERRRRVEATRDELLAQPAVVDRNWAGNRDVLDEVAPMIAVRELDRAFLVGVGDSLAVPAAARIVLEAMLGVPCEPVQSLDLASYLAPAVTERSLVIALSRSGETTRTVEAVLVAQYAGALTVALTDTAGSTLDEESNYALHVDAARLGWPTQSSTAALALLFRLAGLVGRARGAAGADALLAELAIVPGLMSAALAMSDPIVAEVARREAGRHVYLFSGAGPNWASAVLGAAKVEECTPDHAIAVQLGECHRYNSQKAGDPLWLLVPSGPSIESAVDTARRARRFGGQVYVATTAGEHAFDGLADAVVRLPDVAEVLSPLLYLLPAQLMGYHVAMAKFAAACA